jgi:hypothetical protein
MKLVGGILTTLLAVNGFFCSPNATVPDADRQWLLTPQDLPASLLDGYVPEKNHQRHTLFYKKTKTSISGFSAVFGQQLAHAQKTPVSFTVQVSYARTETDARVLYGTYLTVEEKYGKLLKKTAPRDFGVDDALLLQSPAFLYLALRKNLIVYFVQIENCPIDLEMIKSKVAAKIHFLEQHAGEFKT